MAQLSITKQVSPLGEATVIYMPPGSSLDDIAREVFPAINDNDAPAKTLRAHIVLRVAGEEIPQDQWANVTPSAVETVQVGLRAGDNVGAIFQTVLTVAFAATLSFFGVPPNLAWSIASVASSLITNALIRPPDPDRPDASRLYSIEGARNQLVGLNDVAPVILGEHRYVPKFMGPPIQDLVGEDLYLIVCLLWASHDVAISDLSIGDTPITAYEGVSVQHSLLSTSDTPTLYPGAVGVTSVGTEIAADPTDPVNNPGNWVTATTPPNAETIKILGQFPRGLGWLKNGQERRAITRGFEVQYRAVGDANWQTTSAATIVEGDNAARNLGGQNRRGLFGSIITELNDYVTEVNTSQGGGSVSLSRDFTREDMKPFFFEVQFAVPSGPAYEVRMRKKAQERNLGDDAVDEIRWEVMQTYTDKEISPDPRLAVSHIRIKASDQLNGFVDSFNAKVKPFHGVHNAPADSANAAPADFATIGHSRNPADELLFISQGDHNVIKTPDEEWNFPSLSEFWTWCDDNNYTCDLVIDGAMRRDEAEDIVAGCGRARVVRIGGKKTVIIDRAKPIAQGLASARNARDFVFERIFPPEIHALRIPFQNAAINYRQDQLFVYAPGYDENNATLIERFSLPGRTDSAAITADGTWFLRTSQLQKWRGHYTMDIEFLSVNVGDKVQIPHKQMRNVLETVAVTEITTAGADLQSIKVDRDLDIPAGDYVIAWRRIYDDGGQGAQQIVGPLAIDESGVSTRTLTLTSPGGQAALAPDKGDILYIGEATQTVLEGLVRAIEPSQDMTARIHWVDYAGQRHTDADNAVDTHVPPTPAPWRQAPATPVFSASSANHDAIFVSFDYADQFNVPLRRFRCAYRPTPIEASLGEWIELPDLLPAARSLTLPAGEPGRTYDVRIIAESTEGVSSAPMIESGLSAYDRVPAPVNPVITPEIVTSGGGIAVPRVRVAVDSTDVVPEVLETLIIETRNSDIGGGVPGPWRVNTTAPSREPDKDLSSIQPGQTLDVRLSWRNKRGAETPEADRPIVGGVIVPDELTAGDSQRVGSWTSALLQTAFDDVEETIGNAQTSAEILAEATEIGRALLPTTFENGKADRYFTHDLIGAPDAVSDLLSSSAHVEIQHATEGWGVETSAEDYIAQKDKLPYIVGNVYRFRVKSRYRIAPTTGTYRMWFRLLTADYSSSVGLRASFDAPVTGNADFFDIVHIANQADYDAGARWIGGELLPRFISGAGEGDGIYQTFFFETINDSVRAQVEAERLLAQTAAGDAEIARAAGVVARDDAEGFSLAAASSSNLSVSASLDAIRTARDDHPTGFEDDSLYWTSSGISGDPDTVGDTDPAVSYPIVNGRKVADVEGYEWVNQKGVRAITPNTVWEMTIVLEKSQGATDTRYYHLIYGLNSLYNRVNSTDFVRAYSRYFGLGDGQQILKFAFTSDPAFEQACIDRNIANGVTFQNKPYDPGFAAAKWFRVGGLSNVDAQTAADHTQISFIDCRDITSELQSAGFAASAALTESNVVQVQSDVNNTYALVQSDAALVASLRDQTFDAVGDPLMKRPEESLRFAANGTGNWAGDEATFRTNNALAPVSGASTGANGRVAVFNTSDDAWFFTTAIHAVDPTKTYKLKGRFKQVSSSSGGVGVFLGVVTLDGNFTELTGGSGPHRYCAANNFAPTIGQWHEIDGEIGGEGTTHNEFRPGTRFVRLMGICNFENGVGEFHLDELRLVDADDVALEARVTQSEGAIVTQQGDAAAYARLNVDANGAATGYIFRSASTGAITESAAKIYGDQVILQGGATMFSVTSVAATLNNLLVIVGGADPANPDTMIVQGVDFGTNSDLLYWVGPYAQTYDHLKISNGRRAITNNGKTYLNGVEEGLEAVVASDTGNPEAEVQSVDSNGNDIDVTASASVTFSESVTTSSASPPWLQNESVTVTVELERAVNGGAYATVTPSSGQANPRSSVQAYTYQTQGPFGDPGFETYSHTRSYDASVSIAHVDSTNNAANNYSWKSTISVSGGKTGDTRNASISTFEP